MVRKTRLPKYFPDMCADIQKIGFTFAFFEEGFDAVLADINRSFKDNLLSQVKKLYGVISYV